METAEGRGGSRRSRWKGREKRNRKPSHFSTVQSGGLEGGQTICYLWEIVKALEAERIAGARGANGLRGPEKRMRGRVRVEMWRYFVRRRVGGIQIPAGIVAAVLGIGSLFFLLIGIDHVAGTFMYPYINDGDWIVYSRLGGEIRRDEAVVFEKGGETFVKRIAGLPGDKVEINGVDSRVVVNGIQMRENYVTLTNTRKGEPDDRIGAPQTVMNGQYLVPGDNRAVSIDSRDSNIGTITEEAVLGRVVLIIRAGGS